MTHIMAATDLSDRGDRAVHRAILLARQAGAKLTVLTVIDEALPRAIADTLVKASRAELERIVAAFDAGRTDAVQIAVIEGDPARAVADHAMQEQVDLLVLGRHRERPVADLFRQTTVERIVALVSCPVLLVTAPPAAAYATVLEAVDFSPAAAAAAITARTIAPQATHVGLHVYHVPYRGFMPGGAAAAFLHEAEQAEAAWRKRFDLPKDRLAIRLAEGGVASGLAQAIAETRPDLIAVGAHGRPALATAILGSVATSLMREPPCDLLIVRPTVAGFA